MERGRHVCACRVCKGDRTSVTAEWHRAINEAICHAEENNRRLVAGLEALRIGWGGITKIGEITGLDRKTIARGIRELREGRTASGRVRGKGAGRPRVEKKRPESAGRSKRSDEG